MGPASCRSAFERKSILVCNWLLFFGAVTSKRFLLQERHPPTHLCTWAAGRCTKMGIAGFALIQQCGSAAGNFPNLSGSAGALTIHHHHVFKLPVVRCCFGKDKETRALSLSPPCRRRGPQAHALHHLQAKAAVHRGLGMLKGSGGSGTISTKHVLSHLPSSPPPPIFSSPAQLITLYFIPGCHKPT